MTKLEVETRIVDGTTFSMCSSESYNTTLILLQNVRKIPDQRERETEFIDVMNEIWGELKSGK